MACNHTNDFEFSLSLPFDPQGRDSRSEDDSTVMCWRCGQTWAKSRGALMAEPTPRPLDTPDEPMRAHIITEAGKLLVATHSWARPDVLAIERDARQQGFDDCASRWAASAKES